MTNREIKELEWISDLQSFLDSLEITNEQKDKIRSYITNNLKPLNKLNIHFRLFGNNKYNRYRIMFSLTKKSFSFDLIMFGYSFNWYLNNDEHKIKFYKYKLSKFGITN